MLEAANVDLDAKPENRYPTCPTIEACHDHIFTGQQAHSALLHAILRDGKDCLRAKGRVSAGQHLSS